MVSSTVPEFLFPSLLVRRSGASKEVGTHLVTRGVMPGVVYVVADTFVHESAMTADLITGLEAAGFTTKVFSGIVGEPTIEMVTAAATAAKKLTAVAVVGFGGGSALDTAKLVSYQMASADSLGDLKGPLPHVTGLPTLVMIPTTTGTGAEATRVAMFSVDGAKQAVLTPQFVPEIAVLDDALVADLPSQVLAATSLDALSHALESMMSTSANDTTWMFSAEAARRIFAHLPAAFSGSTESRSELLYASFLAGVSLNAGVTLGHSMSYVMAGRHQLAHGVGCALALPYALAYNQKMPAGVSQAMATQVLGNAGASLKDLADAVHELIRAVDLPTRIADYSSVDLSSEFGHALVRDYPRPTNPVELDPERLTELFTYLRSGDLSGAWQAMGANA